MDFEVIEENVKNLCKNFNEESFIFDFLVAYGKSKTTITRLISGNLNQSKKDDSVVILKKSLYFKISKKNPEKDFKELLSDESTLRHDPRFIIVTNFKKLYAFDTKTQEELATDLNHLPLKFDFFLPWSGIEKREFQHENPIDVKAAEKLAKFFDLIRKDNPKSDQKSLHSLNVFLTRLLFCYFAEDTEIFSKALFTHSVGSHTKEDGSDLDEYLEKVFEIMNTMKRTKNLPEYLSSFPYVNGGLFAEKHLIPKFSKASRAALIENGELDWASINPDIFGSMIQAVVHPDQRSGLGMHYTSVTNIMKVIRPLFLDDLYDEFEKSTGSKVKLNKLLQRIREIKIFDPACGSGNFLIIAYKELRILEMKILALLKEFPVSAISLSKFYGIEIDDFAHEVAKLSLWLVQHQMNCLFKMEFGQSRPSLPLTDAGNIISGNACLLNWKEICTCSASDEAYILGNPPYIGSKSQTNDQKEEMKKVFNDDDIYKSSDYITCWILKAANFIVDNKKLKYSFVSTNSICQGEQLKFWKKIEALKLEIGFAHTSFKWRNNAKGNAGVTCVIVGVRNRIDIPKYIYDGEIRREVKNINYYLVDASNKIVERRNIPIANIPPMLFGSIPYDGGYLLLSNDEKNILIKEFPKAAKYIRPAIGTTELLYHEKRWCLWISQEEYLNAKEIEPIALRLKSVTKFRNSSKTPSTQEYAECPYLFKQLTHKETKDNMIIIPRVSSENREYLPIAFSSPETIVVDAQVVYSAPTYLFGMLSSKMHILWVKATSGRLETRIRYSSSVSYNNFPLPQLTEDEKRKIEELSLRIISTREQYPDRTLADLYDPNKMPGDLKDLHNKLDLQIDACFRKTPFSSDLERLQYVFKMFEKLIGEQNA